MVFLTVFKAAMCSGLVRSPILRILISCVCAVCARGRFASEKNQAHSFTRPFPWKRPSNEAMALSFILIDGSSHKIFLKSEFRYWADYHWNTVALIEMAVIYSQLYSQLLLNL